MTSTPPMIAVTVYRRQFVVESYTTVRPATIQGIRRYLGSGLIKGIGPTMAERMVDHFGADILEVIDQAPQWLVDTIVTVGPHSGRPITQLGQHRAR